MTSTWHIKESTRSKPYGGIDDSNKFNKLMRRLKGSEFIMNNGLTGGNEFYTGHAYHVEPEGVTITYSYNGRHMAQIDFHGSTESRERVKERLLHLLKTH